MILLIIKLGDALTIIYSGPIFTMIFSFLFLRIRQGLWKISFGIILMIGVILVVRPPFLFPQYHIYLQLPQGNQTFYFAEKFSLDKETFHWIGVAICFSAACIGGLINVSINFLKVSCVHLKKSGFHFRFFSGYFSPFLLNI